MVSRPGPVNQLGSNRRVRLARCRLRGDGGRRVKHSPARLDKSLLIAGQAGPYRPLRLVEEWQLGADNPVTDLQVLVGRLLPDGEKRGNELVIINILEAVKIMRHEYVGTAM